MPRSFRCFALLTLFSSILLTPMTTAAQNQVPFATSSSSTQEGCSPRQDRAGHEGLPRSEGKDPRHRRVRGRHQQQPGGKNLGFTHVYLLTFESVAARDAYLPHPEHKKFGDLLGKLGVVETCSWSITSRELMAHLSRDTSPGLRRISSIGPAHIGLPVPKALPMVRSRWGPWISWTRSSSSGCGARGQSESCKASRQGCWGRRRSTADGAPRRWASLCTSSSPS